jgi:uncharacterized protein YcfL
MRFLIILTLLAIVGCTHNPVKPANRDQLILTVDPLLMEPPKPIRPL